jgi:two-component system, NarL family, sensor histidine kinase DegS
LSHEPCLRLEVSDDGIGISGSRRGMGMRSMSHRAQLLGANLEVQSIPGQGTRVVCTLPSPTERQLLQQSQA